MFSKYPKPLLGLYSIRLIDAMEGNDYFQN